MTTDPAPVTDEQIAEWLRLADAATEGPWQPVQIRDGLWHVINDPHLVPVAVVDDSRDEDPPTREQAGDDARLIAASRTAVPALCSKVKEQAAEIERLRGLLKRALPSVESDAAMMDAMDRHSPLPELDMPSVTAAANDLDALLSDIRSALPEER